MALKKPASAPREDPQPYVLKKNYKKAIELYRAMAKDAPEDANLALRLADVLVLDSQIPAAVQEYKRAARLYGEQGFLLKAIGVSKKIVKLDPRQQAVHESLSKLYEERGLLAKPETAAASLGRIDFGMEEANDGGAEHDLRLNVGAAAEAAAADTAATGVLEPMPELGADDFAGHELAGGEAEAAPSFAAPDPTATPLPEPGPTEITGLGFNFGGPSPAAAPKGESASALGAFDFGLPSAGEGAPGRDALPEEISLDALGDALSDEFTPAAAASALQSLGEFAPDPLAAGDLAPEAPAAVAAARPPLFSDLTPEEFVEVVAQLAHQTYASATVIVREGDPGDAMFVIVTGSVAVSTAARGSPLQLATMGEGDFFGEGSLITGKPRTATITALTDCELLCLSRSALDEIARTHPRVRQVMREFYEQRAKNTVQAILKATRPKK